MPVAPDARELSEIPLFRGLAPSNLEAVTTRLRRRQFAAGTSVITAETPGETVYVVLSGTVKIKIDQADGTEVIIAVLGPGDIFGELSVIDSAGRSADVITQEDSALLWLDRESFNELLDTVPGLARNLLRIMANRIRLSTEQIQALCTLDVYGRVARQLVAFADLYGVQQPSGVLIPVRLTQSDIAGMVGASRERVNQAFVTLRHNGLVSVDATYRITVHNVSRLREIVAMR